MTRTHIRIRVLLATLCLSIGAAIPASAQQPPGVGYVIPPGGKAGTTVEVTLGGLNWTPDMQFFLHVNEPERTRFYPHFDWTEAASERPFKIRQRVGLNVVGIPGPVLMHEMPYWFGIKSFANDPPLPREVSARFVLPADMPAGPIRWRAANANGASNCGVFIVSHDNELMEIENRTQPQELAALPVTVSGRLRRIEEVDVYRFKAERSGPVTCDLMARRLGSDFRGVLEVRDADQRLIADEVDTEGKDPALTFFAEKGHTYTVAVRDLDYRGYRSMIYRLTVTPGPRVLAAIPAAGKRGETRDVEFIGIGVATGQAKLERITRSVTFPKTADTSEFAYQLKTDWGTAPDFALLVSDIPERIEPTSDDLKARHLDIPSAVTGRLLNRSSAGRFTFTGSKGEMLNIAADARRLGSPLDLALSVLGPDGTLLASGDDRPGTIDPAVALTLPADGTYQVHVSDMSGRADSPTANYRLAIERADPDFRLAVPPLVNVPIGESATLTVNVVRSGGFKDPIVLTVAGMPSGISVPRDLTIPAAANTFAIPLTCLPNAAANASLVQITGAAKIGDHLVMRTAFAPVTGNLAARDPDANQVPTVLIATTIKPPFKVICVEADGGRRVHRGATHLAELVLERSAGFTGEIVLDMAAIQSRHRQGILGPTMTAAPNVRKIAYPVFLPECLETTRTSRLALVGMAKVRDGQGNLRYAVAPMEGQITMSIEGALLKLSQHADELSTRPGEALAVPLKIARSATLTTPVRVELIVPSELNALIHAEPIVFTAKQESVTWKVTSKADDRLIGLRTLTARATAMRDGHPVVSEAVLEVEFLKGSNKR